MRVDLPAETVTAVPEWSAPLAEQALPRQQAATDAAPQIVLADPPAAATDPAPPMMAFSPTQAAAEQLPPRAADQAPAAGAARAIAMDVPCIALRANADLGC